MNFFWISLFILQCMSIGVSAQTTDYKCPKAIPMDAFHYDSLVRVHPLLQDVFVYLKTVQLSQLALGRISEPEKYGKRL